MANPVVASTDDKRPTSALIVSLGISLIIILGALILIKELDAAQLVSRLLWPLTRLMLFITI